METEKAGKTNGSNLWSDSEDREHCSWAPADLTLPQKDSCCRRSWATLVCGSYLLPWGKDNFPGCPKPQQLLLLLAAPTGLHITQASDLSSGPTSYRDALRFAPAHSLLLKHGCSGYPAWTETHSAMTQLFTGLCEQWAPSRRGNDETSGDGYQAGTISPR